MEKTILIKSITPNDWAFDVTYQDGEKEYNKKFSKKVEGANLLAANKMVTITIEKQPAKDGKEYWNVTKVRPAILPANVSEPQPTINKSPQDAPQQPVPPKEDNRNRSMALSYSKDLVGNGQISIKDIYNAAHDFEGYLNGTFKPVYQADWFAKYIK